MARLGRPTQNNKTFRPDYVDASGREYSRLSDADLMLYEDTDHLMPMNVRLPRTKPVENRLLPPEEDQMIELKDPTTKETKAKGRVAEMWLAARSNCGLVFFKELHSI